MDLCTSPVLGLCGASGGLGTSSLAVAVAGLAASLGRRTLLVDLRPNGGGLDQLAGCAHEPGQRWPSREAGMLSLPVRDLPGSGEVRVLSQRGAVLPPPPLGPVALQTVERLAAQHELSVLDLPAPDHPRAGGWWRACGTVVLLAGDTPAQVCAALVARALLPRLSGVVVRTDRTGLDPTDVAHVLGLPLLAALPHDPSTARAALEECWPGSEDGAVRDAAAAVLAAALVAEQGAA